MNRGIVDLAVVVGFVAMLLDLAIVVNLHRADDESDSLGRYTNDFAVEVDGDVNVADLVASTHGFRLLGNVGSLGGVFHFSDDDRVARRSKRSAVELLDRLIKDPNVLWVEQQRVLRRQKRVVVHDKQRELPIRKIDDKSIYQRFVESGSRLSTKDTIPGSEGGVDSEEMGFNDPYFKDQWYLINRGQTGGIPGYDINVLPVWKKGITGRGVVVTILDDGIDHTHPDLRFNYDPKASTDLNDRKDINNDPMPNATDPSNSHGTRCAGEVAAQANNSNCCVGVAFNAKIGGVRMLDGSVTDLLEAEAVLFNNQYIDIYSASWGPTDDGKTIEGPHRYCSQALKEGVTKGRGGKGSIFVWATGNGGLVGDDCSCDGYVSSIYTLSLGCVSDHGLSTYFSEVCPSTMAVVFTGGSHEVPGDTGYSSPKIKVVTTDLHGDCTLEFQGTSSAAPLGAGCVALVLEANADLTWRDVQHVVVETARIPNDEEDGWTVNGAGYHVNHRFGFGALDCGKMVEVAQKWKNVQEQRRCQVQSQNGATNIYANARVEQSLSTDGCQSDPESAVDHLEHVQLHVNIEHEHRGDLSLVLVSPAGTQSNVLSRRPLDRSDGGIDFTFMTVHDWGEDPKGRWILVLKDDDKNVTSSSSSSSPRSRRGRLIGWSLTLYGVRGELENHRPRGGVVVAGGDDIAGRRRYDVPYKRKKDPEQAHRVNAEEVKHLMAQEAVPSSDDVQIVSKNEKKDGGLPPSFGLRGDDDDRFDEEDFEYLKELLIADKRREEKIGGALKRVVPSEEEAAEERRQRGEEDEDSDGTAAAAAAAGGRDEDEGGGRNDDDEAIDRDDLMALEAIIKELDNLLNK